MAKQTLSKPLINPTRYLDDIEEFVANSDHAPASTALRTELLTHFKAVYREARNKAEALLLDDGDGTLCAKRLSHLQDTLIETIYRFAAQHIYHNDNPSSGERLTIAAVGGYGRGTLAPGSDIDLLFILPFKQTP